MHVRATSRVTRQSDGAVVASNVLLAWDFLGRLRGLMGRARLDDGEGLWLKPCSSIHMMFMRFSIDVLWLDPEDRVVAISAGVRPWIGMAWCSGAASALELRAGEAARRDVHVGDKLQVQGGP